MIPQRTDLTICFAHVAYQLQARFELRGTGIRSFQACTRAELDDRVDEADVLVISGLWHDGLLRRAGRLRFIQSIGAGVDQFPAADLAARGIRLASARGVNARAVSDHAMALVLALSRRLPEARDNQSHRHWRPMISDLSAREDELGGKTLLVIGLGGIGDRIARLAGSFDMSVIAIRRDPSRGKGHAGAVHGLGDLKALLPQADYVVLACPLTSETENLVDADALSLMKPSACLVNVARGRCVDEPALIEAMRAGRIAGAAVDVVADEPLAASSPLWDLPNVLITPHTGGETRRYEDNVLDVLQDNLERLWRGEVELRNQVV